MGKAKGKAMKQEKESVKPTPVLEAPAVPVSAPVLERVRERGAAVKCRLCGADAFAVGTRNRPAFMAIRIRRYKCSKCGENFKRTF
jgi:formylmethanofuran dehydrogenase subunit E